MLNKGYTYKLSSIVDGKVENYKTKTFIYKFIDKENRKYFVEIMKFKDSFTVDYQEEDGYIYTKENNLFFDDVKYTTTNRHDAFNVISTVFNILSDWYGINHKGMKLFHFNAPNQKRLNIYKNRIERYFPKWKLSHEYETKELTLIYDLKL